MPSGRPASLVGGGDGDSLLRRLRALRAGTSPLALPCLVPEGRRQEIESRVFNEIEERVVRRSKSIDDTRARVYEEAVRLTTEWGFDGLAWVVIHRFADLQHPFSQLDLRRRSELFIREEVLPGLREPHYKDLASRALRSAKSRPVELIDIMPPGSSVGTIRLAEICLETLELPACEQPAMSFLLQLRLTSNGDEGGRCIPTQALALSSLNGARAEYVLGSLLALLLLENAPCETQRLLEHLLAISRLNFFSRLLRDLIEASDLKPVTSSSPRLLERQELSEIIGRVFPQLRQARVRTSQQAEPAPQALHSSGPTLRRRTVRLKHRAPKGMSEPAKRLELMVEIDGLPGKLVEFSPPSEKALDDPRMSSVEFADALLQAAIQGHAASKGGNPPVPGLSWEQLREGLDEGRREQLIDASVFSKVMGDCNKTAKRLRAAQKSVFTKTNPAERLFRRWNAPDGEAFFYLDADVVVDVRDET